MSLPDIDKVREHEAHGGLWRENRPGFRPSFWELGVDADGLFWQPRTIKNYQALRNPEHFLGATWTPCTPAGDPLHLVERVAELEAGLAQIRADLATLHAQVTGARDAVLDYALANLTARLSPG